MTPTAKSTTKKSTVKRPNATTKKSTVKKSKTTSKQPAKSAAASAGTTADEIKTTRKKTSKKTSKKTVRKTTRSKSTRAPFEIAGHKISAGKRMRLELPIGNLMSGTPVALPLIVAHGRSDGPVVWLSAAIHGDEICGVEIIRQVLDVISAPSMSGTVIAAPIVNVHGFNTNDRYLPDRRDLNRCFPGSSRGSLASRIANLFMKEVVRRSDVGIDLHTGSDLRTNLAQIRCDIDHGPTLDLATVFAAPIVIDSRLRDGSLRQAAVEEGKISLLFEGGEASRFDPAAIAEGTAGVLRTLNHLGVTGVDVEPSDGCLYSKSTSWSRASKSGIIHLDARLGELVRAKDRIATIYDPYGKVLSRVKSKYDGIIIGHTQAPLANRGDAISHVARLLPERPTAKTPPSIGAIDTEDG